jgi:hypothetical protein
MGYRAAAHQARRGDDRLTAVIRELRAVLRRPEAG